MANAVGFQEIINGNNALANSRTSDLVQQNLAKQFTTPQVQAMQSSVAPVGQLNLSGGSNVAGFMSGLQGIGNAINAGDRRVTAQANADALAAKEAEQTNYNRSKETAAFNRLLAGDARTAQADALQVLKDTGAKNLKDTLSAVQSQFLDPRMANQEANANILKDVKADSGIQVGFDKFGGLTLTGVDDEAQTRADNFLAKMQDTESVDKFAIRDSLKARAKALNTNDNEYDDVSPSDLLQQESELIQMLTGTKGLDAETDANLKGNLSVVQEQQAKDDAAAQLAYDAEIKNLPAGTSDAYQSWQDYNKKKVELGVKYAGDEAFLAKMKGMVDSEEDLGFVDTQITDALNAAELNAKENEYTDWYENADGKSVRDKNNWDPKFKALAYQRALSDTSLDGKWYEWGNNEIDEDELQERIQKEMNYIIKNQQSFADRDNIELKYADAKTKRDEHYKNIERTELLKAHLGLGNVRKSK